MSVGRFSLGGPLGTGKLPSLKFMATLVFDPGGFAHDLKIAADIARLQEIKTADALGGSAVCVMLHIPDQSGASLLCAKHIGNML